MLATVWFSTNCVVDLWSYATCGAETVNDWSPPSTPPSTRRFSMTLTPQPAKWSVTQINASIHPRHRYEMCNIQKYVLTQLYSMYKWMYTHTYLSHMIIEKCIYLCTNMHTNTYVPLTWSFTEPLAAHGPTAMALDSTTAPRRIRRVSTKASKMSSG